MTLMCSKCRRPVVLARAPSRALVLECGCKDETRRYTKVAQALPEEWG